MRYFVLIVVLVILGGTAWAQPGSPPPDPGDPVPFTGLEWLIGSGLLLGVGKRLHALRRAHKK